MLPFSCFKPALQTSPCQSCALLWVSLSRILPPVACSCVWPWSSTSDLMEPSLQRWPLRDDNVNLLCKWRQANIFSRRVQRERERGSESRKSGRAEPLVAVSPAGAPLYTATRHGTFPEPASAPPTISLPLIHRHIHRGNKRWAYEIKSPPSEKEMASVPLFVFGKHSVNQRLGTVATRVVCDSLRSVTLIIL